MITGIIWKVEELPTPVKKNSAMKPAKKPQKDSACSETMTSPTEAIMPAKTQKVTRPPPTRSDSQPVPARLSAPTSGPRKTNCSAFTSGKARPVSSGKPAE